MNAKKVAGFFLMKPAFTQRNITSVGLVALFFVVYILMGGKVTTELPKVNKSGAFGSGGVDSFMNPAKKSKAKANPSEFAGEIDKEEAKDILGMKDANKRSRASMSGELFSEDEKKAFEGKPLDKDGLVSGVKIKRNRIDWSKKRIDRELKGRDMLKDIEDRLDMRKRNK